VFHHSATLTATAATWMTTTSEFYGFKTRVWSDIGTPGAGRLESSVPPLNPVDGHDSGLDDHYFWRRGCTTLQTLGAKHASKTAAGCWLCWWLPQRRG
jgi:hypothetical protein